MRDNCHAIETYDVGSSQIVTVRTKGGESGYRERSDERSDDGFVFHDTNTVSTGTATASTEETYVEDMDVSYAAASSCSAQHHKSGGNPTSHQQELSTDLDWSFLREGQLFDRKEQQKQLLEIFRRKHHTNKDFVLVSGLSGTGKTVLVQETLKDPAVNAGGYFLLGKLDQLNKKSPQRPYAPFVAAFSKFVDLVAKRENEAETIRALTSSHMIQGDIDLLLETFPSLTSIIRPMEHNDGNKHTEKSDASKHGQNTNHARLFSNNIHDRNKSKQNENQNQRQQIGKAKFTTADNQKQLARIVRTFLECISNPDTRPIVLLIDDLQWADSGTLVLLHSLLQAENLRDKKPTTNISNDFNSGLLLVGTCRHNEVGLDDDLAKFLRTLEDEGKVTIRQIEISNLSRQACGELVARILGFPGDKYQSHQCKESLAPLVDIAYGQTQGNAFLLLQFLRSLHEEGYLKVQSQPRQTTSSLPTKHEWLWNEEVIRGSNLHGAVRATSDATPDPVLIMAYQMMRLPPHVQETLKVAACLGAEFSEELLYRAMPCTVPITVADSSSIEKGDLVSESLDLMIFKELVRINSGSGRFQFCHDKIQQAALTLIPEQQRDLYCTNIGRRILEHAQAQANSIPNEDSEYCIFLIVNLLSHGISADIIKEPVEKMMVATVLLEAGELAAAMSDFATAATYLNLGIECLQSNFICVKNGYWKHEYNFSLAIYNAAAEVEYCTANFERMDCFIKEILLNARCFQDKMRAYITMIYSLGSRERLLEAIAQGFSLLEVLGEHFPRRDNKIFLLFDLIKTKRMVKTSVDFYGDLDRLPLMQDERKLAAIQILNIIFPYCMMLKHPKTPLAAFRMVQLSVKHGFTETSATGFSGYGLMLSSIGDFMNGNRNGKFALRLLDRFQAKHLIPRVYSMYYGFISNWNTPLKLNLKPTMDGHKAGLSTGDIEFAMVNAVLYATNSFHAGQPLAKIQAEVFKLQELTILFRQKSCESVISPILQQVYNLRSSNHSIVASEQLPWILTGTACNEEQLVSEALVSNNVMCLSQFNFRKLWMAYVFRNYDVAFEMAEKSRITIKSSPASFMVFSHYFFEGMTCMALAANLNGTKQKRKRKRFRKLAAKCLKTMNKYMNHCKLNCQNKVLMLEAELKIAQGDLAGGLELFKKSASISHQEGLMHEQAIAYERAGLAVLSHQAYNPSNANTDNKPSSSPPSPSSVSITLSNDQASKLQQQNHVDSSHYFFGKSIAQYKLWGATAKVEHMIAEGHGGS